MRDELVELLRGTKVRLGGRALRDESTAEETPLWEERRSA